MGSKRRYKPIKEEHRVYHKSFDRYRLESRILNSGNEIPNQYSIINDHDYLQGLLLELKGNEKGEWFNSTDRRWCKALLPTVEEQLKQISTDFKNYKQQKVNEGFSKPDKMPTELYEKQLKTEARLDVLKEEIEEVERRLKTFDKQRHKVDDKKVLRDGPVGVAKLRDGVLAEISGQRVSLNKNSALIIDDTNSPYDGMLVADYRKHVSEPWSAAKRIIDREKQALQKRLYDQGKSETFAEEWKMRMNELLGEHAEWENLFSIKISGKPTMPKWPEGIKNWKSKKVIIE